ncbi:hypothetical protein TNCV_2816841 [Trichonephila clavipes]|nr:hypothetical protein TNCV_2816841 [Trichonephila clavipes]
MPGWSTRRVAGQVDHSLSSIQNSVPIEIVGSSGHEKVPTQRNVICNDPSFGNPGLHAEVATRKTTEEDVDYPPIVGSCARSRRVCERPDHREENCRLVDDVLLARWIIRVCR